MLGRAWLGFLSHFIRIVNPTTFLILALSSPLAALFSQNPRTGDGPVALDILDLDRDARADLVVANYYDNSISLFYGMGGGSLGAPIDFPVGIAPTAIVSGDVDLDGLLDIIVANSRDNTVSVLHGARGGGRVSLAPAITVATNVGTASLAAVDVNGDGLLDLVAVDRSGNVTSVLDGHRGWGALQLIARIPMPSEPVAVAADDLNRDGHIDLVVASRSAGQVSVLIGDGRGHFSTRKDYDAGQTPVSVCVADVDGDGWPDVVVANEEANQVSVLSGDGKGNLAEPSSRQIYQVGDDPLRALVEDVNNDRIADILTVNGFPNIVSVLLGQGGGKFAPADAFNVGSTPLDLGIADVNDDGKPDIITANFDENSLSLLLNTDDRAILAGDADQDGRLTIADVKVIVAEIFDGDGDSPLDTPRGFVATGAASNANGDTRISVADVVAVLSSLRRE